MNWQLQEAKNKLSKVVEAASKYGPQVIAVRGKEAAVVWSIEEFRWIAPNKESLAELLPNTPLRGSVLVIERLQALSKMLSCEIPSRHQRPIGLHKA